MTTPDPITSSMREAAALETAYIALLQLPHDGGIRNSDRGQGLLAACRDALAFAQGRFAQDVQDEYDARALRHKGEGLDEKAQDLWRWIENYLEAECGHLPDYLNDAERSNIVNAIFNTLALAASPQTPVPEASGVRVKALEWEQVSSSIFDAQGALGLYRVKRYGDTWTAFLYGTGFRADRATVEEAKAAAQADYEARIKSALEPASPQPARDE